MSCNSFAAIAAIAAMAAATRGKARPTAALRATALALLAALPALAGLGFSATSQANPPPEVRAALHRAGVPEEALSFVVQDLASGRTLLEWQAEVPMNPASLAKLVTTQAALDRLGPAWTWATPVWVLGTIDNGVLEGDLHIKGSGDPRLVHERVWLLLRRVMQLGVREIRGDIVIDNSAFAVPGVAPGEFDGEVLRPYNVRPAALLLNHHAVLYTFTPDAAAGLARVSMEPALARTEVDRTVPLAAGACSDWRGALEARLGNVPVEFANPTQLANLVAGTEHRLRFAGRYPAACGEQHWWLADAQPASYNQRLLEGLWREMGGTLAGRVREGQAPAGVKPTFEHRSPPLAEVVRDINKFSNNVMAEQLALTLAREAAPGLPATPEAARGVLLRWLGERFGRAATAGVVLSNGSGLSRESRLSARLLARLLVWAHAAPTMPELMASLPVSAVDGTTRGMRSAAGRAHLKGGSLRDAAGVAGYVLAANGRRLVLAAIINDAQANAARPALEALVQWAYAQAGTAHAQHGPPMPAARLRLDAQDAARSTLPRTP